MLEVEITADGTLSIRMRNVMSWYPDRLSRLLDGLELLAEVDAHLTVVEVPPEAIAGSPIPEMERIRALAEKIVRLGNAHRYSLEEVMDSVLGDLEQQTTDTEGVMDSAITLIGGLSARLESALQNQDQATVIAISAELKAKTAALAAAIAANPLPAAPPVPVTPPVAPPTTAVTPPVVAAPVEPAPVVAPAPEPTPAPVVEPTPAPAPAPVAEPAPAPSAPAPAPADAAPSEPKA